MLGCAEYAIAHVILVCLGAIVLITGQHISILTPYTSKFIEAQMTDSV